MFDSNSDLDSIFSLEQFGVWFQFCLIFIVITYPCSSSLFCVLNHFYLKFNKRLTKFKNETPKYGLLYFVTMSFSSAFIISSMSCKKNKTTTTHYFCTFLSLFLPSLCPNTFNTQCTVTFWASNFSVRLGSRQPIASSTL